MATEPILNHLAQGIRVQNYRQINLNLVQNLLQAIKSGKVWSNWSTASRWGWNPPLFNIVQRNGILMVKARPTTSSICIMNWVTIMMRFLPFPLQQNEKGPLLPTRIKWPIRLGNLRNLFSLRINQVQVSLLLVETRHGKISVLGNNTPQSTNQKLPTVGFTQREFPTRIWNDKKNFLYHSLVWW